MLAGEVLSGGEIGELVPTGYPNRLTRLNLFGGQLEDFG